MLATKNHLLFNVVVGNTSIQHQDPTVIRPFCSYSTRDWISKGARF